MLWNTLEGSLLLYERSRPHQLPPNRENRVDPKHKIVIGQLQSIAKFLPLCVLLAERQIQGNSVASRQVVSVPYIFIELSGKGSTAAI